MQTISIRQLAVVCLVAAVLVMSTAVVAPCWERGNHAETWTKGQTVRVCVDPPPGTAADQAAMNAAIAEAIEEWNTAQAEFGGLNLVLAEDDCDVQVKWEANASAWGSVAPGTDPVELTVESNDGLNQRGWTRIFKHEFGHVEGLGHSAESELMKADAYTSTPGQAPSADDLNSDDPFIEPTADDKAGKKELYGTAEELSKSEASSTATYDGGANLWVYDYQVHALTGPAFVDPVTEFTIDLPGGLGPAQFTVTAMPPNWDWNYYAGAVTGDKQLDVDAPSPALLSFTAATPGDGVAPGDVAAFQITSTYTPTNTRAFTNSPSYDTDEAIVKAPTPVIPTLSEWGAIIFGALLLASVLFYVWYRRRLAAANA